MINDSSYPQWRAYVENHCPDVYIKWENNRNVVNQVLYQARHEDMPDIVAIRRFESDTTAQLEPYLSELGRQPLAETFKPQYLSPYTRGNNLYWLPAPGVVDGLVANIDVFEQYDVPLPVDRASFLDACRKLDQYGIAVCAMDCKESWTAVQVFEGFSLPIFTELGERKSWLQYSSAGVPQAVRPEVLRQIADRIRLLHSQGILTQEDLDSDTAAVDSMMVNGRTAMFRKVSDELFDASRSNHYAALPFFGDDENSNWLYTYPVFSLAMARHMEDDSALYQAASQVLTVMLSEGAQQALNASGMGLISYNKDIRLPVSSDLERVRPLIEADKCFIRTLNSQTFTTASQALTSLIRDDVDDDQFIHIVNNSLFHVTDPVLVGKSNIAVGHTLDESLCSPAASVVAQVLRQQTGADCAVIDISEAPSDIYKGDYMVHDIQAITRPDAVYRGTLTGSDMARLMDGCILDATTFRAGSIEPVLEYPAFDGMTTIVHKDGTIQGITFENGKSLVDEQSYDVVITSRIYKALASRRDVLTEAFHPEGKNLTQYFMEYFFSKGALPMPRPYFNVQ